MFLLNGEMHIENAQFQYIARISHGKDSLKMLDVIVSRGLRLDRITTTDVWATDTIRGEYPEMVKFKERADEYIWRKYRIEVEHLCAMKDGEKVTYEKLFYHIPKRKPKNAGGGAFSATRDNPRISDALGAVVPVRPQEEREQAGRRVFLHKSGAGAKNSKSTIYGFPVSVVRIFHQPRHKGQYKYRGIPRHSSRRTETVWAAHRQETRTARRVRN